ncbi:MAG: muramoyltetrapeptide carboxypeptidase [Salibacteraceae bacterium]
MRVEVKVMKKIDPLIEGDTVLIISPAKTIESKYIDLAQSLFQSWGLKVEVAENAMGRHNYFAGKDVDRANDLQWALNHPTAKAIVATRGGYGSIRIVDEVDYSGFIANPKWLIGFSDITVFHNKIHGSFNLPSIHAVAPLYFDQLNETDQAIVTLKGALFGKSVGTTVPTHKCNRLGTGTGVLVGGNLAVFASLVGTSLDISTDNKVLFLEDVSEYAYRIDRMLWSLKKSGKLKKLAGLVIGGLTDIKLSQETFGCSVEELVQDVIGEFDYPVMFNFPAGHQLANQALVLGTEYKIEVNNKWANLTSMANGKA